MNVQKKFYPDSWAGCSGYRRSWKKSSVCVVLLTCMVSQVRDRCNMCAGGCREPRRIGTRVAAGSGRRCCTGAFLPAGLFGGSYELRLPLFPQPLGRALKKRGAAPASPPCFRRRRRSAPLLFSSHWASHGATTVDIPTDWNPRAKRQPTGLIAYLACGEAALFSSHWAPKRKSPLHCSGLFSGVPSGTRTRGLQIHNLAR